MRAVITYRPRSQKTRWAIREVLGRDVLEDICKKITGQTHYSVVEDNSSYNKGRLVIVDYEGKRSYVTLSERKFAGRNSSIQSVPTALNIFYQDHYSNKELCYYFLGHTGNAFTNYHIFMYRLMATAGIRFVNILDFSNQVICPFRNVDDLIYAKRLLRQTNSSNNSSFVAKNLTGIQIYAKVYGASKYESTLLAFATSRITSEPIDLFNIREHDLQRLPESSRNTLHNLNIRFHDTSLFFDARHPNNSISGDLRSPAYTYNLLHRIGDKQCAFCGCPIQEIIQGAHIWSVANIRSSNLSDSEKFKAATSGDNGLWLCPNHHRLFDANMIMIAPNGSIRIPSSIDDSYSLFIKGITHNKILDSSIMSNDFVQYLNLRNASVNLADTVEINI